MNRKTIKNNQKVKQKTHKKTNSKFPKGKIIQKRLN